MAAITVQEAQNVAFAERPKGVELLHEALGWEPFDEAEDAALGILLDFHYDNLMYCQQKGFPWTHVCSLVDMAAQVAEQSRDKSLSEGLKVYHNLCLACCQKVSEQNIKQFTQYFFETFFHHYELYQYVFNTQRDSMIIKLKHEVDTPTEPLPFTDSKQIKIWEYDQKMKEIEEEEISKKTEQEETKKQIKKEKEELFQKTVQDLQTVEHPLDKESLASMINEIASLHITAAGHAIKSSISSTMTDLELMLMKTSLPRPQELGPPPRHKPKTPASGGKRPKSKGSAKAKAK